mgnify:CR=1 FL=1
MLVQYLFAETNVQRIQAVTDVTNRSEQRALEKAGFVRLGEYEVSSFLFGRIARHRALRQERTIAEALAES